MWCHASAGAFVVQAPAKLNLFFEVLAKREDGYHEIETLMCPITLFDTLWLKESSSDRIELACREVIAPEVPSATAPMTCNQPSVPEGCENLAYRAVELLREKSGVKRGVRMLLVKRIPAVAGLGGGSSDAAAALVAANRAWRLGFSNRQLMELAAELGSDVPFFLARSTAVCRGRGEQIASTRAYCPMHFVVVRPPAGLSTAAVYAACRPPARPQSVEGITNAIRHGELGHIGRLLLNRLQPVAESLTPWIQHLAEEFSRQAVLGHAMSGSGTAYFGLCRSATEARRVARRLRSRVPGRVFTVQSCR